MAEQKFIVGDKEYNLEEDKCKEMLRLRLKDLLCIKNVSFLLGNGCSLILGAPKIGSIRKLIPDIKKIEIENKDKKIELLNNLLNQFPEKSGNSDTDLETLLKMLINLESVLQTSGKDSLTINGLEIKRENVKGLITLSKQFLYDTCKKLPILNSSNNVDPLETHRNF